MTSDPQAPPTLPFTGERFVPECGGGIWHEHWHRYVLAGRLAEGRAVLDAACGEGFGAHFLAGMAATVDAIDVDAGAVLHARSRYAQAGNLTFHQASVEKLPFPDYRFDLVVSFETIEHLAGQEAMLREFRRVLRPGGLLLLSSPNRPIYSDGQKFRNEFHVKELDRRELDELVRHSFPHARWFGQRLLFHSVVWSESATGETGSEMLRMPDPRGAGLPVAERAAPDPMYFILVCGEPDAVARAAGAIGQISCFDDPAQSLLMEHERLTALRWEMQQRIGELNAEKATQAAQAAAEIAGLRAAAAAASAPPASAADAGQREVDQATLARLNAELEETRRRWAHRETLAGWLKLPLHKLKRWLTGSGTAAAARPEPPAAIVIPVYQGLEATVRCIDSVLASALPAGTGILVIDDATPEPRIAAYLDRLASAGRITLLRHAANQGFVQSANEGMAHWPDRDVVLLNSDTIVASDWVQRLRYCTGQAADIGTATPFSNNATICSFPRFCEVNALPAGVDVAGMDAVIRTANARRWVEIPTAVGFCMYVSRRCLDQVGAFDAARFGRGYGEENDFCMRAARQGWRHALCADVYVFHEGGVSFQGEAENLKAAAQATLRELHPDYEVRVREFVQRDPVLPLRASAIAALDQRPSALPSGQGGTPQ